MSRSLVHILVCTTCKSKFSSVLPLEASDGNCVCWGCYYLRETAQSSTTPDVSLQPEEDTSRVNGTEDLMETAVASSSKGPEFKEESESMNPASRLCGILKKIKARGTPARPSSSHAASQKTSNKKTAVKNVFFKKGMHLPKRGSNCFVCPDCSYKGSSNDLVSQMSMLNIRPIDDHDEGVVEDITVDSSEQEVPEHGEYLNHENFFIRHPHLLGDAMASLSDMNNPARRHTGQCGHQASSFMARCHVCKRRCDISSPSPDLFGCLICYFRSNLNSKRNRSPDDFYG